MWLFNLLFSSLSQLWYVEVTDISFLGIRDIESQLYLTDRPEQTMKIQIRMWHLIRVITVCDSSIFQTQKKKSYLNKICSNSWRSMVWSCITYVRKIPLPISNFPTQKYNFLYHANSVFLFQTTILAYAGFLNLQWCYQMSFYAMEPKL